MKIKKKQLGMGAHAFNHDIQTERWISINSKPAYLTENSRPATAI